MCAETDYTEVPKILELKTRAKVTDDPGQGMILSHGSQDRTIILEAMDLDLDLLVSFNILAMLVHSGVFFLLIF